MSSDAPTPAPGAALSPGLLRSRRGKVVSFDVAQGVGVIVEDDGGSSGFHCTAIPGGSRVIEVGTAVAFRLEPYHGGQLQAGDLTLLS